MDRRPGGSRTQQLRRRPSAGERAKLAAVLKHIDESKIWYKGSGTDGIIPTKNGWVLGEHYDLIGDEYDFSGY